MTWVLIIGAVIAGMCLGLLLSGWFLSGRPDLVRIGIEGEYLVVHPLAMAKVFAFRGKLRFERTAIRSVKAVDRDDYPPLGLRLAGTGLPYLLAGRFTTTNQTGLVFCLAGRARRFIQIDLDRGNIRYLVIQVRDPDSLAAELAASRPG